MSKTISYRGRVPMGQQEKINLKTIKGKIGYKVNKFQIISQTPGISAGTGTELVGKIYSKSQEGAVSAVVDFTEGDLLAVAYNKEGVAASQAGYEVIIFDNAIFNQNIFVTMQDASGNTIEANYYIELEVMPISDLEATKLTLQSIRTITSNA